MPIDPAFPPPSSDGARRAQFEVDTTRRLNELARRPAGRATHAFAVGRSGSASYATGATVVFDAVEHDVSSWYSTATGRFTPRVAGIYSFAWAVSMQGIDPGEYFQTHLSKNSAGVLKAGAVIQAGAGWPTSVGSAPVIEANGTTDYFHIVLQHNNGGTGTAWAVQADVGHTYFQGYLLAAL